jgi:DNA polymerase I
MTTEQIEQADNIRKEKVLIYKVEQGRGNKVWLCAKTQEREDIRILLTGHHPYLYTEPTEIENDEDVIRVEEGYENIDGDEVQKVVVEIPRDVRDLRDYFDDPHEADVPYTQRVIIDEECLGWCGVAMTQPDGEEYWVTSPDHIVHLPKDVDSSMLDTTYYDIEVKHDGRSFPDAEEAKGPVIAITVYDKAKDDWIVWSQHRRQDCHVDELDLNKRGEVELDHRHYTGSNSEREMMKDFSQWVRGRDPDVMAGWNSTEFDWPYLVNRMPKLGLRKKALGQYGSVSDVYPANSPGTLQVDLLETRRKLTYTEQKSNALGSVAEEICDINLVKESGNIADWWENDLENLVEYNVHDVEATWLVDESQDFTKFSLELYFLTMVDNVHDVHSASIVHDVACLQYANENDIALPMKPFDMEGEGYSGATVLDPKDGLHENVASVDFTSLYPYSLMAGNMSPDTYLGHIDDYEGDPEEDNVFVCPHVGHVFDLSEEGMFYDLAQHFMEGKKKYTKIRDNAETKKEREKASRRRWARKVMVNCFSPDTEIVTANGIKNIQDVEIGERVFSINPDTREVEMKKVKETIEQEHNGKMAHIQTTQTDLKVTPNHRMLVNGYYNRDEDEFIKAKDLDSWGRYQIPVGEPIEGEKQDVFELPEGGDGPTPLHNDAPDQYEMDDWLEFIAWYITEGSLYKSKRKEYENGNIRGVTHKISIAQEMESGRKDIRPLIESMGLSYYNANRCFSLCYKPIFEWLKKNCGKYSENKKIPEFVFELSADQRQHFLNTLMRGDGDRHRGNRYTTKSDELKEDVLNLIVGLGYKPIVRYGGCWRIRYTKNKGSFRPERNMEWVPNETGKVYCVTVEDNHTVLAGRNRKFQWVGQSLYGALGFPKFRLYRKEVAESITALGREMIETIKDKAEDIGHEVIQGDTDSAYFKLNHGGTLHNDQDRKEMFGEAQEVCQILEGASRKRARELNCTDASLYELELESISTRLITGSAKKRYAQAKLFDDGRWLDEPKVSITGFGAKRADTPKYSIELQEEIFDRLLRKEHDPERVVDYIKDQYVKVRDGEIRIGDVASTPRIKKPFDEYDSNYYAVAAAEYTNEFLGGAITQGDRIYVVYVTNTPPDKPDTDKIALESIRDPVPEGFIPDWDRHAELSVQKKTKRIMEALGKGGKLDTLGNTTLDQFG